MSHREEFLAFAREQGALRFGSFTLKSGRVSPYFFNAGQFHTGGALARLGQFYAQAIVDASVPFDMLFGPAYKGIPLVAAVAVALAEHHARDVAWAFNRKEAKDHGEGGILVGAPLAGRVLVIDDVITAGTAIREVAEIFAGTDAEMAGVSVALDRQEKGRGELSAIQEVERDLKVPVIPIVGMSDIIAYLEHTDGEEATLEQMRRYRREYGV